MDRSISRPARTELVGGAGQRYQQAPSGRRPRTGMNSWPDQVLQEARDPVACERHGGFAQPYSDGKACLWRSGQGGADRDLGGGGPDEGQAVQTALPAKRVYIPKDEHSQRQEPSPDNPIPLAPRHLLNGSLRMIGGHFVIGTNQPGARTEKLDIRFGRRLYCPSERVVFRRFGGLSLGPSGHESTHGSVRALRMCFLFPNCSARGV